MLLGAPGSNSGTLQNKVPSTRFYACTPLHMLRFASSCLCSRIFEWPNGVSLRISPLCMVISPIRCAEIWDSICIPFVCPFVFRPCALTSALLQDHSD